MSDRCLAVRLLALEARGLLTRLARVRPFVLNMPMVPAAALSPAAQSAVESHLISGRSRIHNLVRHYLAWLEGPEGCAAGAAEAQRRYAMLKLSFNAAISDFEIFADVLSQRSEHETGVWVAGLDRLATDALNPPGLHYAAPPVICYLDRGHGAAIRRARTRLPGGGGNPVAVVRLPRERMVGSGLAASVVHEVGHQGSALLGLVPSLRAAIEERARAAAPAEAAAWRLWSQWISEIVCDFWSTSRLGVAATLGLMGVVSLPRVFVFRPNLDDPHPMSWLRVKLSCAMGREAYPHPQWDALAALWEDYYPRSGLPGETLAMLETMEATMPALAALLADHRPDSLDGRSLREALVDAQRKPALLAATLVRWRARPDDMLSAAPTHVFAVIGQAKADGRVSPETESRWLAQLLTTWAMRGALDTSARCAARLSQPRGRASAPASVISDSTTVIETALP